MFAKSTSSRVMLWAAVLALLLKAAVPMFAAGAAHVRGVPVAEVCPVYGVALPSANAGEHAAHHHHAGHAGAPTDPSDHNQHDAAAHAGDHCALTALATFAPHEASPLLFATPRASLPHPRLQSSFDAIADAHAEWAARLQHAPPQRG